MQHQDWTPVIIKKRSHGLDPDVKKRISQLEPTHIRQLKSDDVDVYKNKMFEMEFVKTAINKRVEMKLSQRDLAKRLNVDASIVQKLEQGKLVYDPQLKSKLNRILSST
jgi:ribosome-binding protein aMBF1 (putative translation factor)